MLDSLKHFFDEVVDKVDDLLGDNQHDTRIATCALFVELAHIDEEFNAEEQELILKILREKYILSKEHATDLLQEAKKELKESTDLWQFTRLINENYTYQEKIKVVELLWNLVFVDGKMDQYERYLIDKISNLLHIGHDELIDLKLKVIEEQKQQ